MLNDVSIATSGKNSRKQQGVGACPLNSYLGIRMHACARVLPCMARGLLGLGMGASDWDSTPRLLCLLAEVRAPSTVMRALAMYKQLCMRETGLLLSPNLLPIAESIQASNSCSKCSSHLQIGRPSNTIISHLPLARSLERVSELVYIIKRLRTENQSPHTGHHLPPRKL